MKIKSETIVISLFIIFVILIFISIFKNTHTTNMIVLIYTFLIVPLIGIIYLINKNRNISINKLIENFKKHHIIVKILTICLLISIIYDLITIQNFSIQTYVLISLNIVSDFCEWFFKPEE